MEWPAVIITGKMETRNKKIVILLRKGRGKHNKI